MKMFRKKRNRAVTRPPKQDIPEDFTKGVPVLYMLQRVSEKHCRYINGVSSRQFKEWEIFILDLFVDKAFVMSKKVKPPGDGSLAQVKFGISQDVHNRVATINKGIFKTGTTEWRLLNHYEMMIANAYFFYWRNRWRIRLAVALLYVGFWLITFNQ